MHKPKFPTLLLRYFDHVVPPFNEHTVTSELFLSSNHPLSLSLKSSYCDTYSQILTSLSNSSIAILTPVDLKNFILSEGYDISEVRVFLSDSTYLLFKCIFSHPLLLSQLQPFPPSFCSTDNLV